MSAPEYSTSARAHAAWVAPVARGPLAAHVQVPGSKSLTGRALVLAALADGPSLLGAPLHSVDSARMIGALGALGVQIDRMPGASRFGDDLLVHGTGGALRPPSAPTEVDCGQAGTVMRFVAPLAGLANNDVHFTADASALHRPMGELIQALRELGVDVDDAGRGGLPFTVRGRGRVPGGEVRIDASRSSQFVSGLLLSAARFDNGVHIVHTGDRLPSLPHIDMTIEVLAARGVRVERPAPNEWIVAPAPIRAGDVAIEPDLSNAAPFLAAALVAGGEVTVGGWPARSTQPGALLPEVLGTFGADVVQHGDALTVRGSGGPLRAAWLDLTAAGELAPTIAGLAAFADGPSEITGIGHIRLHETDRLAALVSDLRSLGCGAEELADGIRITPAAMHAGAWGAFHDHRMATTGALVGLRVAGVRVDDIGTTAKTLPEFSELWHEMLGARVPETPEAPETPGAGAA